MLLTKKKIQASVLSTSLALLLTGFYNLLNADDTAIETRPADIVAVGPLLLKQNLREYIQEANTTDLFQPEEKQYVYSILIDAPFSPQESADTNEKLQHLKALGLSCRTSETSESESLEPPKNHFTILCGRAETISELHNTIRIAQDNRLNFHVTLTTLPHSKER